MRSGVSSFRRRSTGRCRRACHPSDRNPAAGGIGALSDWNPAGSPGWRLKSEGTEKPCGQGGSAAVSAAFFGACRRCLLLPRIRPPLFPRRGCSGRKGEKLFSKEDGAPKEGKKNLWDGPGAKPAGCPFFGGGRKGRLFCF
ncbi:MAG: hypothetical protein BAA03_11700 [Caldibacillus debilis]|nr:MAG: hypothetical protein BAA03_11700 [Caldibacillus debilis]